MLNVSNWTPISEAPKNKRVLLYRPTALDWSKIVVGKFDDDKYARRPRPYWTHDQEMLEGKNRTRSNQPTHFMELPEPPDSFEGNT